MARKVGQTRRVDYKRVKGVAYADTACLGIEHYVAGLLKHGRRVHIGVTHPAPVSMTGTAAVSRTKSISRRDPRGITTSIIPTARASRL